MISFSVALFEFDSAIIGETEFIVWMRSGISIASENSAKGLTFSTRSMAALLITGADTFCFISYDDLFTDSWIFYSIIF